MLLDFARLGWLRFALIGLAALVCVYLLAPIAVIVALSFGSSQWLKFPPPAWTLKWYRALFADPEWLTAFLTSFEIAALVAALSTVIGLMAAFALTREEFRGREIMRALFLTPMVLPVVIFAVALYSVFLRLHLNGTLIGFVLAHLVIALPFSIIAISNSLERFDASIEDAAVLCGASRIQARLRVTLPGVKLGLYAAAIFSFLASWDEVVVAIFMASPDLQTLPVKIYTSLRQDLSPVIAAVSSCLVALTALLMLAAALLQRGRAA